MNILMVASEVAPYLRTGDVAKVVLELGCQLRRQGHDIRIVIPRYRSLSLDSDPRPVVNEFDVPLGAYSRKASVHRTDYVFDATSLPVYLVGNPFYFGRENPYGYFDDYERFIFFTRAILEMLQHAEFAAESWQPQVIHGHDWIAGLMPFWLRHTYREQPETTSIAFAYTLHNAAFPGQFGSRAIKIADLLDLGFYESIDASDSRINFMARGILAADAVNTVSPQHADEIMEGIYDWSSLEPSGTGKLLCLIVYENKAFDECGNWTCRVVESELFWPSDFESSYMEYRTLLYYSD